MIKFLVNPTSAAINADCGCYGCFGQGCSQDNACIRTCSHIENPPPCGTQGICLDKANCRTNITPNFNI